MLPGRDWQLAMVAVVLPVYSFQLQTDYPIGNTFLWWGFMAASLWSLWSVRPDRSSLQNRNLLLPLHAGQALDGGLRLLRQPRRIDPGARQQRLGPVFLLQHGRQQVLRLDVGVVVPQGQRLRVGQGFLELGGEFVESHGKPPNG